MSYHHWGSSASREEVHVEVHPELAPVGHRWVEGTCWVRATANKIWEEGEWEKGKWVVRGIMAHVLKGCDVSHLFPTHAGVTLRSPEQGSTKLPSQKFPAGLKWDCFEEHAAKTLRSSGKPIVLVLARKAFPRACGLPITSLLFSPLSSWRG
jgi:hypothetical protein